MIREEIETENSGKEFCSSGIAVGDFIYLSGILPEDTETGSVISGTAEKQMRQILKNMLALLEARSLNFDYVVKTTVYLTDMEELAAVRKSLVHAFKKPYPACTCIGVKDLPSGASIEMDAFAIDTRALEKAAEMDPCNECEDQNCIKNGGKQHCEGGCCWTE